MVSTIHTAPQSLEEKDMATLVDLAISGECPGILPLILTPGLTAHIALTINNASKPDRTPR